MTKLLVSKAGRERGTPQEPLVLFGHLASTAIGELISTHTTLNVLLVESAEVLTTVLRAEELAGIAVQSRMSHPGEAGRAIAAFHAKYPTGRAAFYQAWDYNVERGSRRALEYGADGVLMPAIDGGEFFGYLFGLLQRVAQGAPRPASIEEHRELLRQFAPTSKFWEIQDLVVSDYF